MMKIESHPECPKFEMSGGACLDTSVRSFEVSNQQLERRNVDDSIAARHLQSISISMFICSLTPSPGEQQLEEHCFDAFITSRGSIPLLHSDGSEK